MFRIASHPDEFPEADVLAVHADRPGYDALRLRFSGSDQFQVGIGVPHDHALSGFQYLTLLRHYIPKGEFIEFSDWVGERREYLSKELQDAAVATLRAHNPITVGSLGRKQSQIAQRIENLTAAYEQLHR
jgi:hypothetical protein